MKRWLSHVGLLLLLASSAYANQGYSGTCSKGGIKVITSGISSTNPVVASYPGCTVTINIQGGGLATIFSDNLGTPLSNPFTASSTTGDWIFYAANGRYSITMSSGTPAFPSPEVISDVLLNDPASPLGCSALPAITGDITSSNCATTLATVATPGTGLKATINAKGLVTNLTTAASTDLSDTAVIARLNAAANFGTNPVTTGALSSTTGVFSGALTGIGATFSSEVAPNLTGVALGDTAHRWDGFFRNLDFSGSLSFANITSTIITSSKINGFYYVDNVTYTTVQQAITAACGQGGGTVFIMPGQWPQNTGFALCSNLNLVGAGKCQVDATTCPTTITTTMTTGDLFPFMNMTDSSLSNFGVKNIGAGSTGAAIKLDYGQRIVAERLYISGPFNKGIALHTSSTSTGSTIWNTFRDIHITGLGPGGIGCDLDSSDSTNKPINNNLFLQVSCQGGATGNGVGMRVTNNGLVVNQQNNENFVYGGEFATNTGAGGGTGILFTTNATRGMTFVEPNVESNVTGVNKQGTGNTVLFLGGNFSSNTTNVTDNQSLFSSFLNTNVSPTVQQFAVSPDGGVYVNCIGLNAVCAQNVINGPTGWGFGISGTQKWAVNTGSLSPFTAAGSDFGETLRPIANIFVGGAATNNNKITSAVTTGARIFTLPDANSNSVIPDTGAANNFLTAISALGVISKAQPSFSNLSGSIVLTQTPLTTNGDLFTVTSGVLARLATGTSIQVLHGLNTWSSVVSADLNITTTTCTNQFLSAISATGTGTCTSPTLASAQFVNQGTTTTVLHGNAAGNPSFAQITLTTEVTGVLPTANGGTAINSSATFPSSGTINTGTGTTNNLVKFTTGASGIIGNATPTDNGTTFAVGELLTATGIGLNGAGASANTINTSTGFCIQTGGGCRLTYNTASLQANVLLDLNTNAIQGVTTFSSSTNCASSASPAACGSAMAGRFVVAAAATSVVVNTSAVTTNSEIQVQQDDSLGTALGVTCNTGFLTAPAAISARSNGVSFTVALAAGLAVNPVCFSYTIVN